VLLHQTLGGWLVYAVTCTLIGSRMRALANLLHESVHGKLFKHRQLNAAAGRALCAWPIVVGPGQYRRQHRLHHKHLWNSDLDPDRQLYQITGTETKSFRPGGYPAFLFKHVVLVVLPYWPLRRLLSSSAGVVQILWLCAVYLVVLALDRFVHIPVHTALAMYWIVPWLTTYQMITYWAELAEHAGLKEFGHHWGSRNWTASALMRWLIGPHSDDTYHLLHHWFPSIPHYRLRAADLVCGREWPEYRNHLRCNGFFVARQGTVSVMGDIWRGGQRQPASANWRRMSSA
jgi:fatty acid desaturase